MLHRFLAYLIKNQVLFALFIIALCWFAFQIKDILVSIFLSYIIMASVVPFVKYLDKKKFPRVLAVLIPYFGIISAIFLLILPLVPFVFEQIQSLITKLPQYLNHSGTFFGVTVDPKQLEQYLSAEFEQLSRNALEFTRKLFGGLFSFITIFVVSFYLLMYHDTFKSYVASLFKREDRQFVFKTVEKINDKLGAWMRGQVVLSLFIGIITWIGLSLLGLPYALPLALVAGLLEVVPTLGPILSAIPAIIIAFTISPTVALTVVALYLLIQALENQLLVPKVMQKAVGLNPVVVILGVMIGSSLMGIAGALLAIPFISFLLVLWKSIRENQTEE